MAPWKTLLMTLVLLWPTATLAQDDEFSDDGDGEFADDGDDADDGGDADDGDEADDGDAADDGADEDTAGDGAKSHEWAFGPYFRYNWVPGFMLQLFTEEAPTVGNAAYGVAATYRPEDSSVNFEMGIGYASYAFEDPFRATGDPVQDTEWAESDLGMVHLTGSILWDSELVDDMLSLEYGIGLDFGIVTGSLVRSEAYLDQNGDWRRCNGPLNPAFTAPGSVTPYCEQNLNSFGIPDPTRVTAGYDEMGAHYGVTEERVPPVALVPMLPRIGIAFSPIKEIVGKFDVAYGIFQFSIGLSVAYVPAL